MIPKAKIRKLRAELKGQSMKVVAERLGVSEQAVFAVLRGSSYSEKTIEALIVYRDEIKEKTRQLIERI